MNKLNIPLMCTLLLLSLVVCPILYIYVGPALNALQIETLKTIGIVAGCSALLCFTLGEITRNNSQVDKIWSLLPIVYCWIIAAKGGMHPRLVVMAVLATLWGLRLTYNFARKGAYKLRFWEGEEDYRWEKVRALPFLQNRTRERREFTSHPIDNDIVHRHMWQICQYIGGTDAHPTQSVYTHCETTKHNDTGSPCASGKCPHSKGMEHQPFHPRRLRGGESS